MRGREPEFPSLDVAAERMMDAQSADAGIEYADGHGVRFPG